MPLCPFHPESNGWCARHQEHASGTKAVKMPKPPKPETETTKAVKAELKKMYPVFLAQRPKCEIQSPNCTKKATCIHHTKGRGKNEVLDVGTWKASCETCNLWCEDNHAAAEAKGLKQRRHHKKKPELDQNPAGVNRVARFINIKAVSYLQSNPTCRINSPWCSTVATMINHGDKAKKMRDLMDEKQWKPSCKECNEYLIETASKAN